MVAPKKFMVLVVLGAVKTSLALDNEGEDIDDGKIVGGSPVHESNKRYPWHVEFWGCGGMLITKEWVLTAAHCTFLSNGGTASIGLYSKIPEDNNFGEPLTEVAYEPYIKHPQYVSLTDGYDFALVRLSEEVDVEPVQVDTSGYSETLGPDDKVWPIGFGTTSSGGSTSDILLHAEVNYVPNELCNEAYGDITDTMVCAASSDKDACQGDSGGPLYDATRNVVIGITSWGIGCADPDYPGVYARISEGIDWIESYTGKLNLTSSPTISNSPSLSISPSMYPSFSSNPTLSFSPSDSPTPTPTQPPTVKVWFIPRKRIRNIFKKSSELKSP